MGRHPYMRQSNPHGLTPISSHFTAHIGPNCPRDRKWYRLTENIVINFSGDFWRLKLPLFGVLSSNAFSHVQSAFSNRTGSWPSHTTRPCKGHGYPAQRGPFHIPHNTSCSNRSGPNPLHTVFRAPAPLALKASAQVLVLARPAGVQSMGERGGGWD